MQGGRGGRDRSFGFPDPFAGFGGFGGPSSLMSSFFGGRDPFDDPFFTRPFGGMFESSLFGSSGSPFANMHPSGFLEHQNMLPSGFLEHQPTEPKIPRGPIIEELNSDDEKEEADKQKKENPRKHGRSSNEPYVEDPDDEVEERRSRHLQYRNNHNRVMQPQHQGHNMVMQQPQHQGRNMVMQQPQHQGRNMVMQQPQHQGRNMVMQQPQLQGHNRVMQPQLQGHSFTVQSSTVTYGGANGAYYTSSKTRRTGSDGLTIEESKEADTATRQAAHRISRGLHNKGHSFERKLNSDGKVDTMQTLHNLNEDELAGFEEAWNGNARKHLPGWTGSFSGYNNMGASSSGHNGQATRGGWALPSIQPPQHLGRMIPVTEDRAGSSHAQHSGRMNGPSDVGDRNGYSRGRTHE